MSFWYEAKLEDVDMSVAKDELHIYLYSDDNGAVYCSVSMDILKKVLPKID